MDWFANIEAINSLTPRLSVANWTGIASGWVGVLIHILQLSESATFGLTASDWPLLRSTNAKYFTFQSNQSA